MSAPRHLALLALLALAPALGCGGDDAPAAGDAAVPDATIAFEDATVDASPDAASADAGGCTGLENPRPQPNVARAEPPGVGGCPAGMVPIAAAPAFCIDRFEASLVSAADGTPLSPFYDPAPTAARAVSVPQAIPQAYISQVKASAACQAAGKRLCTDAEWLRACGGPTGTTYPYGATRQDGRCNDHRAVHPAVEYFGSSDPSTFTMLQHPCLDQLPDTLDRGGANGACISAEGVFDLMGNLREWTADPAGTSRGGDFVDTTLDGNGCQHVTTAHDTSYADFSIGFRCCF